MSSIVCLNLLTCQVLAKESVLLVELCNVLHRTVLTRPDSPAVQTGAMQVLQLVLICATEKLEAAKRKKLTHDLGVPANKQVARDSDEYRQVALLGEGGDTGNIEPAQSVVFAALEVCFCILVRYAYYEIEGMG